MKAQPALAPAGWRAADALNTVFYIESYAWLPRLVGWLFGMPSSLPLGWPVELGLGALFFLFWFFLFRRQTLAPRPERAPHRAALLFAGGIAGVVAVTGVFLPDDLPAAAYRPAALTLGIAFGLVSAATLYAGYAIRQSYRAQVAQRGGADRPSA